MVTRLLPKAAAVVLDSDKRLAQVVARRLRTAIEGVRVLAFSNTSLAWQTLRKHPMLEPYIVVTDLIGVLPRARCFVGRLVRKYPRSKIVLFSGRATPEDVVGLQNRDKIINRYVKKDQGGGIDELVKTAQECFLLYQQDPILDSLRQYLIRCRQPMAPFMQTGSRHYSLRDIYWEIVKRSEIGCMMETAWRSLLVKATLLEEDTGDEQ